MHLDASYFYRVFKPELECYEKNDLQVHNLSLIL